MLTVSYPVSTNGYTISFGETVLVSANSVELKDSFLEVVSGSTTIEQAEVSATALLASMFADDVFIETATPFAELSLHTNHGANSLTASWFGGNLAQVKISGGYCQEIQGLKVIELDTVSNEAVYVPSINHAQALPEDYSSLIGCTIRVENIANSLAWTGTVESGLIGMFAVDPVTNEPHVVIEHGGHVWVETDLSGFYDHAFILETVNA